MSAQQGWCHFCATPQHFGNEAELENHVRSAHTVRNKKSNAPAYMSMLGKMPVQNKQNNINNNNCFEFVLPPPSSFSPSPSPSPSPSYPVQFISPPVQFISPVVFYPPPSFSSPSPFSSFPSSAPSPVFPSPSPSPTPIPTISPTLSPNPNPTPTPTSLSPSVSPSVSPSLSSASASASPSTTSLRKMEEEELTLLANADLRGIRYIRDNRSRPVFPSSQILSSLSIFDEPFPHASQSPSLTLQLLDDFGSPATTASNGPNYYGFVLGASLPAAAAAERMVLAWDQSGASFLSSPISDKLERIAGLWALEALNLPRSSAVGFGTSASACTLTALAAARRELLIRQGWDYDNEGLSGAPEIKVVVPELVHITVKKALRILGFGAARLKVAPVDSYGRVDPARLPPLDPFTILILQAGELNTGEFDPFAQIIPQAKQAGAWVHIDGAFGLWARASSQVDLTTGVEQADSWTTDGHKWLNTPYDCAMVICRDPQVLTGAMTCDAVAYLSANTDAQKNLTLEFSRRPRGISVWAALRVLGKEGVKEMVDKHCKLAKYIGEGLKKHGFEVLNRVVINQVLFRCKTDEQTKLVLAGAQESGKTWFGASSWQNRPAMRISVSSWRTQQSDADELLALLARIEVECRNK